MTGKLLGFWSQVESQVVVRRSVIFVEPCRHVRYSVLVALWSLLIQAWAGTGRSYGWVSVLQLPPDISDQPQAAGREVGHAVFETPSSRRWSGLGCRGRRGWWCCFSS